MATRVEALEAELEVAQLEEKLIKAKGTKRGPKRELKEELREARRAYRERRNELLEAKLGEPGE